ncbi:hypothetical protein L2750_06385 [Shewanella submarina]|uniref:Uncharacterized protein n=1 Tax=Shewanella submarina TaxID=2016376 RepID=A0ABV7G924_9GAMM|nr:hypothetical protein [Shewanella submarina]MCL1036777.1 hypothetical protein [Shewanella submarina]
MELLSKMGANATPAEVSLESLPVHIAAMIEAKDVQALSRELDLVPEIVCAFFVHEDEETQVDSESEKAADAAVAA